MMIEFWKCHRIKTGASDKSWVVFKNANSSVTPRHRTLFKKTILKMKIRKHLFSALLLKVFSLYVVEETQVIAQSPVWRSCCFLHFPSIHLDCHAGLGV